MPRSFETDVIVHCTLFSTRFLRVPSKGMGVASLPSVVPGSSGIGFLFFRGSRDRRGLAFLGLPRGILKRGSQVVFSFPVPFISDGGQGKGGKVREGSNQIW